MRVLVAVAIREQTTAVREINLYNVQSVFVQQWDAPLDYMFIVGGDGDDHYQNVTDKYERARFQALAGGYDALFCVESDMIVPPDALAKLVTLDADVGYGLYCFRHGQATGLWSAYPKLTSATGSSLSVLDKDEARACWGHAAAVAGVGLGCTLIKRNVLEAIEFHHALGDEAHPIPVHCDWMLSVDCQRLGFTQAMDFSIICGHFLDTEPRTIVWPDVHAPELYRIDRVPA